MSISRGVYFLANDAVYDLVVAFLNSFRKYDAAIPLCLIPYDNNVGRMLSLSKKYEFLIFRDDDLLAECDRWSYQFHDAIKGQYRKLVAWAGPFDEFLYIDIDTVAMQPLSPIFKELKDYSVVTGHSHIESSRKFVWKDSVFASSLSDKQINYAANTGFILSRHGVLPFSKIRQVIGEAIPLRPHMELMCCEQPFLNYLIIRCTERYTSLSRIGFDSGRVDMPTECWAGDDSWRLVVDGKCTYDEHPKNVLFVHWAGEWAPLKDEDRLPNSCVRKNMKNEHIWKHYRYLGFPLSEGASAGEKNARPSDQYGQDFQRAGNHCAEFIQEVSDGELR